jgi:hypothetical protein
MVERQEEFNADINLLMSVEMWYLHHIKDGVPHDINGPWLGD